MLNNVALYLGTVCLLAAMQMFFFYPLAPPPDVAAVGETSRRACRHNSVQSRAVQVFSPVNLGRWRWIGSRRGASAETPSPSWRMTPDGLSPFYFFYYFFLFFCSLSLSPTCFRQMHKRRQRLRGNQLGLFPGSNHSISLIVLPHLFSHWGLCMDPETLKEVHQ